MAGQGAPGLTKEQQEEAKELRKAVHLNMGMCHLKVQNPDRAIEDCNYALALDPQNVKALFRRGQAYMLKRDAERAGEDLNNAARLAPDDKSIQQELRKHKQMEAHQHERQRKVFAAMFDKLSKEDPMEETEERKVAEPQEEKTEEMQQDGPQQDGSQQHSVEDKKSE